MQAVARVSSFKSLPNNFSPLVKRWDKAGTTGYDADSHRDKIIEKQSNATYSHRKSHFLYPGTQCICVCGIWYILHIAACVLDRNLLQVNKSKPARDIYSPALQCVCACKG